MAKTVFVAHPIGGDVKGNRDKTGFGVIAQIRFYDGSFALNRLMYKEMNNGLVDFDKAALFIYLISFCIGAS